MKITKEMLDTKMLCFDVITSDETTYREWIAEWEEWHSLEHKDLDSMTDEELNDYYKYIDYLVSN